MEPENLDVERSKVGVKSPSRSQNKASPFDSPKRGPTLSTSTSSFEVMFCSCSRLIRDLKGYDNGR